MAKDNTCEKGDKQVGNQEVYFIDSKQETNNLHIRLVRRKEAGGLEIEAYCKEGDNCSSGNNICSRRGICRNNKRSKTEEEGNYSGSTSKSKGLRGCVLPKWFQ